MLTDSIMPAFLLRHRDLTLFKILKQTGNFAEPVKTGLALNPQTNDSKENARGSKTVISTGAPQFKYTKQ